MFTLIMGRGIVYTPRKAPRLSHEEPPKAVPVIEVSGKPPVVEATWFPPPPPAQEGSK